MQHLPVDSLFIVVPIVSWFLCFVLFRNAALTFLSGFAIILLRKSELVDLFYLCFCCRMTISVVSLPCGAMCLICGL